MPRSLTPKRWQMLPGDIQAEAKLQIDLGVHPVMARLLVQRGLTTSEAAEAFLYPSLDRMHDPFLLPDAEAACVRIKAALANHERILVHGDYDGDGVTSTALWTRFLRTQGADVDAFVPHRKRDGYDMRVPIIEQARQDGVKLIITTDCGIQRVDEVEHARQFGIDVIITDHHTPKTSGALPQAVAVVNPHRKDSRYPFPDLAGVGVAFKLCEALTRFLGMKPEQYRRAFMDLACIGTVTDVMPLMDENRILVKFGLEALQSTRKPGLRALIDICGATGKPLDSRFIGYQIGPRLNAASRVSETQIALDVLMTKDDAQAAFLARKLHELNAQRQEEQAHILEEAMEQIVRQDMTEARCLVISGTAWTSGLVGIVAGRIAERFHRPTVVIAMDEATGRGRGSARSIHAFNMFNAIDACRDLLGEYGGHAHAAGLSIDRENVPDFTSQMNRIATSLLTEEDMQPTIEVAAELSPDEICPQLLEQMATLAPFGNSNLEPCFVSKGVPIREIRLLKDKHLKLTLKAEGLNGKDTADAIWWNMGFLTANLEVGQSLDVCYRPEFNYYNGRRSIQFMLHDLRPPEW
jgi:single-stranded-DNA-specific exonuclease